MTTTIEQSTVPATALRPDALAAADAAVARSEVYGLLARALSHPDAAFLASLRDGAFVEDLAAALAALPVAASAGSSDTAGPAAHVQAWQSALAILRDAAGGEAHDLARQHLILFGPAYFGGQSPYETAYLDQQLFQKMQEMADIAGFYRAFGLETASVEQPDFLTTELEFMHFLAYREARARELGHSDGADICWQAQRSFLRDHLGRWALAFCARLGREEGILVYAALGALAAEYLAYDAAYLDVSPRPIGRAPVVQPPRQDDACGECLLELRAQEADHAST